MHVENDLFECSALHSLTYGFISIFKQLYMLKRGFHVLLRILYEIIYIRPQAIYHYLYLIT